VKTRIPDLNPELPEQMSVLILQHESEVHSKLEGVMLAASLSPSAPILCKIARFPAFTGDPAKL